jgi:hypothetical protein
MENHHFQWVNPLKIAIFNSHVKLPEGNFPIKKTEVNPPFSAPWKVAHLEDLLETPVALNSHSGIPRRRSMVIPPLGIPSNGFINHQ